MSDVIAQYPAVVDKTFEIRRGDASVPIKLQFRVGTSGGLVPLDTFGSAWACQMRTSPDAALAAEFTVDSSNAAAGWIVLNSLPGTVTAALKADETYGADVEATGGTLSPFTVWSLTFYVKGDYTR
jgi:hypothetical protein